MKKIILTIVLAFSSYASAQVGINTETPKATLDISANPDGTVTVPSGLLIPRVTRTQAASVTTDTSLVTTPEESTLIYVSEMDGAALTSGVARDINTIGFYYYSISEPPKWIKIVNNPDGTSNSDFIFNNGLTPTTTGDITNVQLGGDLEKSTTITTSVGKNLAISGNINNAFSVDDETFSVDGATNNVGIGTTTPRSKLHVLGSVQFTNSLKVGDTASEGTLGQYLVSGGPGESPKWVNGPSDGVNPSPIAVSVRNGLNTVSDDGTEFVELGGTIYRETILDISSDSEGGNIPSFNITGGGRNAFSVGGDNLSVDNAKDFVGVGTATPLNKLHIYNDTAGAIRIADGTQAANRVLTSDGNGVGTWKALPTATALTATNGLALNPSTNTLTLGGRLNKTENTVITATTSSKLNIAGDVTNAFSVGGNNFSVDNTGTGKVGIGTTEPTNKLHINNGTTPGAIKIQDGTQSNGRVLTSNADGVGTWQNISVNNITGKTPIETTPFGNTDDKYMNSSIELKPGKWFVYLGYLVNGATEADTRYAARFTLSSSDTTLETNGFRYINNNRYVLAQMSNGSAGAYMYGLFVSGVVRVEITTTQTLYVWDANTRAFGNTTDISLDDNGENYLFAIQAN